MNPFDRKQPDLRKVRQVKKWVRARLALSDDAQVVVVELTCSEPGCPPIETAVTVLLPDGSKPQRKLHRAAAEIDQDAIDRLWSDPETGQEGSDAHHGR